MVNAIEMSNSFTPHGDGDRRVAERQAVVLSEQRVAGVEVASRAVNEFEACAFGEPVKEIRRGSVSHPLVNEVQRFSQRVVRHVAGREVAAIEPMNDRPRVVVG